MLITDINPPSKNVHHIGNYSFPALPTILEEGYYNLEVTYLKLIPNSSTGP